MSWYQKIPKIELHRHLEGAVRLGTIANEAKHHNLKLPYNNLDELKSLVQVVEPMNSLEEVLNVFQYTQSIFVAPEVVERVAFEAVEDAWNDGIRVLELRYCPSFLIEGHQLNFDDALGAIKRGIQRGKETYDMGVGLIAIVSRSAPISVAEEIYAHIEKNRDSFVGFDLADVEANFDIDSMEPIFSKAHASGWDITIHSGEEKGTAPNVISAIKKLHAKRIGHGVQIAEDKEALACVKESGTILELCPTSNYLTRAVDSIDSHPIRKLFQEGVTVTLNSDDPSVFGIDLTNEYRVCSEVLGFSKFDIMSMIHNGIAGSFLDIDQINYYKEKYFVF